MKLILFVINCVSMALLYYSWGCLQLSFRSFRTKIDMLDNLLEIEVAYNLLQTDESGDKEKDAFDAHYEKLKTDITVSFTLSTRWSIRSVTTFCRL